MIDKACQLASTGLNQFQIFGVVVALLLFVFLLIFLNKKYGIKTYFVLPLLLLCYVTFPTNSVSAQQSCSPSARLSDDIVPVNFLRLGDGTPIGYEGRVNMLTNDIPPIGQSYNPKSVRLSTANPILGEPAGSSSLILDPNDPTPPVDPSDPFASSNVWGTWYLELTCDISDTTHCYDDNGTPNCILFNSYDDCWPTGYVSMTISSNTLYPTGSKLQIQYTAKTEQGMQYGPATVTAILPEPTVVPPDPDSDPIEITASTIPITVADCDNWSSAFPVDLMDYVSTTGPTPLDPLTIDLDPNTVGRQTSVTKVSNTIPITLTINSSGILSVVQSSGGPNYTFNYTIADEDGNVSDPANITLIADICEIDT